MSVIVNGIGMPKNCWECFFNKSTIDRMDFCSVNGSQYNWGLPERPSDCPLEEVPDKPKTNADRIRAMSDEELESEFWRIYEELRRWTNSRIWLHQWLMEEVEE